MTCATERRCRPETPSLYMKYKAVLKYIDNQYTDNPKLVSGKTSRSKRKIALHTSFLKATFMWPIMKILSVKLI